MLAVYLCHSYVSLPENYGEMRFGRRFSRFSCWKWKFLTTFWGFIFNFCRVPAHKLMIYIYIITQSFPHQIHQILPNIAQEVIPSLFFRANSNISTGPCPSFRKALPEPVEVDTKSESRLGSVKMSSDPIWRAEISKKFEDTWYGDRNPYIKQDRNGLSISSVLILTNHS